MNITKTYCADFGPARSGLTTVGYTLIGGPRVTSGVAEVATGTGIYSAPVTHDTGLSGQILWDTGGLAPSYAVDEINPTVLASNGLDGIQVEAGVNARQALSPILAAAAGPMTVPDAFGTGDAHLKAPDGTLRATVVLDGMGNRTSSVLWLPV